jgi:hypothetical protein
MDACTNAGSKNWRAIGLATLVVWMLLLSSCRAKPISYRPPNLEELQDFSEDQDIDPVADTLLDDSIVLLYEKGSSFGYYVLSIREPDGEWVTSNLSAGKSSQPILIIQQISGDQPFIAVIIQDEKLLTETTAVEAVIDSQNHLTSTTNNKQGVILWSPSPIDGWRTINLYNAQGEVLYSQESP